jgi:tetratricopeptide (TPR) repeat protein
MKLRWTLTLFLCQALLANGFYTLFQKGERALAEKRNGDAIELLQEAIKERPNSSPEIRPYGVQIVPYYPYTLLAEAFFWRNQPTDLEQAEFFLSLAIKNQEADPQVFPEIASRTQRLKQAIDRMKDPVDPTPIDLSLVDQLINDERLQEANEELERLQQKHPDDGTIRSMLYMVRVFMDKLNQAQQSQSQNQPILSLFLEKARSALATGDLPQAYTYYSLLSEEEPHHPEAAQFIKTFETRVVSEEESQQEIQSLLQKTREENKSLLEQIQANNEAMKKSKDQLESLRKTLKTPEVALVFEVVWDPRPVEGEGMTYLIDANVFCNRGIERIEVFINGKSVQLLEDREGMRGRITPFRHTFTQRDNNLFIEVTDQRGGVHKDPYLLRIPKRDRPLAKWAPRILLVLGFFLVSFAVFRRSHRQLMAFQQRFNPYIAGAPISSPEMFFGRDRLVAFILNTIHNNSLMISGERRIGKTSLLHQVYRRLKELDDPDYAFYPVHIDLQGVQEEEFFHHLWVELCHAPSLTPFISEIGAIDVTHHRSFMMALRSLIQTLNAQQQKTPKIVLIMDEVDLLNTFSERTNQQLRAVFMKTFSKHIALIMAGIHLSKIWKSEGSPWFNFFEQIELKPFKTNQAIDLIESPVKGVYHFSDEAKQAILDFSQNKPYLIQRLCVNAIGFVLQEQRQTIQKRDVQRAIDIVNQAQHQESSS